MPRYAAFLRGVSPMNCKMPELKRALEQAGFDDVKTLLSSGNAVFGTKSRTEKAIAQKAEAAMQEHLGRSFETFVRSIDDLKVLLDSDPFAAFKLKAGSKRVVTFLHAPPEAPPKLPIELHDARIWQVQGREVLCSYVPNDKGPVFMHLLEKTFGKSITTRTWDTVQKCAR